MFRKFFILEKKSVQYKYVYPTQDLTKNIIEEPFLFPCDDIQKFDHGIFAVVLTEISGDQNFLISTYINNGNACICFQSDHAWFELLYAAMGVVIRCHLYLPKKRSLLEDYLNSLLVLPAPIPGLVLYVPGADSHDSAIKVVVPTKTRQRPFSVFVSELRSRFQFGDWLIIFESLLLEKWIIFHSNYLDRVTSCIFAALSLLFPLEWVHLIFPCLSEGSINCLGCPSPYVAGIHSCLLDRVIPFLSSGAVIVDIDLGTLNFVSSEADTSEDERLPKTLVNFLWRSWSNSDMKVIASKRRPAGQSDSEDNVVPLMVNGFRNVIAFLLGKYSKCKIWDPKTERYIVDKRALALSRGDMFQEFIGRLLESQMIHQFLDDKVNVHAPDRPKEYLTISLNDADDFEESCLTMDKWQPDIYTDTIATIASKSKRKINVLANKVLDIAKKAEFGNLGGDPNDSRYTGLPTSTFHAITVTTTAAPTAPAPSQPTAASIACNSPTRHDWIKFEEDSPFCAQVPVTVPAVEVPDLLSFHDWGVSPATNIVSPGLSVSFPGLSGLIRDFDPLFQS